LFLQKASAHSLILSWRFSICRRGAASLQTNLFEENFYEFQFNARCFAQIIYANPWCSFSSGDDIASVCWDTAAGHAGTIGIW
jgi:hypothetical protein